MDDELWSLERALWTGGADHFESLQSEHAIMAFPPPVGIISGSAISDSLRHAPRWTSVEMEDCVLTRPADNVAVLAYRATGRREGEKPYIAICSSVLHCSDGNWQTIQHQQTPVGMDSHAE